MAEPWITSWYWTWGHVHGDPPSEPQWLAADAADALGGLVDEATARDPVDRVPAFLALAHARMAQRPDLDATARVEYRVAPTVRFPDGRLSQGRVRTASTHVRELEQARRLGATRGPFHLGEVIAQAGIALLTVRADLLADEPSPRLATYLALAMTHSTAPGEPLRIALYEVLARRIVRTTDDLLSRAWHAPLAGGELLTLLPPLPRASVSATVPRVATPDEPRGAQPPPMPTREIDSRPTISQASVRRRKNSRD